MDIQIRWKKYYDITFLRNTKISVLATTGEPCVNMENSVYLLKTSLQKYKKNVKCATFSFSINKLNSLKINIWFPSNYMDPKKKKL